MPRNLGHTSLKRKRRQNDPMRDFDRLPPELRAWLSTAALPWAARSVQRAYDKAIAETSDTDAALQALDALELRLITRDAESIWGSNHPDAKTDFAKVA